MLKREVVFYELDMAGVIKLVCVRIIADVGTLTG